MFLRTISNRKKKKLVFKFKIQTGRIKTYFKIKTETKIHKTRIKK